MDIFQKHIKIIKELDYEFYNPKFFIKEFKIQKIKVNKKPH